MIARINVVSIGEKESLTAGDILANLRKTGQTLGIEDVLIAASAMTNQYIVVTANTRHFARIKGLKIENWLENRFITKKS
ncbi:MAG: PIN domain-containing protein [Desulfobacterales bacterium]|nr:PIN domain-containing protein [Desulfobacterales bacterium]